MSPYRTVLRGVSSTRGNPVHVLTWRGPRGRRTITCSYFALGRHLGLGGLGGLGGRGGREGLDERGPTGPYSRPMPSALW